MHRFNSHLVDHQYGYFCMGNMAAQMTPKRTVTEFVFVDGVNRGAIYHRNGTWHWQRSIFEIIDYPRECNQADAIEFVRIRCNGTKAEIRRSTKGRIL